MALTIPSELAWVLDILGYDWPQLDEDEIHRAATILRQFEDDLNASIEVADARVREAYEGATGGFSTAQLAAWDDERSGSMRSLSDIIAPAATGVDGFADAVLALKLKVIAELVITAAQIAAAVASAAFTFGLGAAASVALIAARKKALDVLTDIAIDAAVGQVLSMVIEPLVDVAEPIMSALAEAPIVDGAIGEAEELVVDLAALDSASAAMTTNADDQERLGEELVAQLLGLRISTA